MVVIGQHGGRCGWVEWESFFFSMVCRLEVKVNKKEKAVRFVHIENPVQLMYT